MIRPHPLDVIQYARSSYYYNNVYVYIRFVLFSLLDLKQGDIDAMMKNVEALGKFTMTS